MLVGNRWLKIIFMTFGWVILLLLLVHWVMPQYGLYTNGYTGTTRPDTFKGFGWFFEQCGKFPGIEPLLTGMKQWIASLEFGAGTVPDGIWIATGLDYVITVMKILVTPFVAVGLAIYNIAQLFVWILGFFAFA